MATVVLAYLLVALVISPFWIYQFIQLMLLSESDFPDKYDKYVWVVVFLVVIPLAPIAFLSWKRAYLVVRQASQGRATG